MLLYMKVSILIIICKTKSIQHVKLHIMHCWKNNIVPYWCPIPTPQNTVLLGSIIKLGLQLRKLELCHRRDKTPHLLYGHRMFCMLPSQKHLDECWKTH